MTEKVIQNLKNMIKLPEKILFFQEPNKKALLPYKSISGLINLIKNMNTDFINHQNNFKSFKNHRNSTKSDLSNPQRLPRHLKSNQLYFARVKIGEGAGGSYDKVVLKCH